MGFCLLCFVGLIVLGGFLTRYFLLNLRWKSKRALTMKLLHRISGFTMIAFAQLNINYGLKDYWDYYGLTTMLGSFHLFSFIALVMFCETIY